MFSTSILPCTCGYPLCHVTIIKTDESVSLIYPVFYGNYSTKNFFTRIIHWIKEGRKAEFEYDVILLKSDVDVLKKTDPTITLVSAMSDVIDLTEEQKSYSIENKIYFKKREMSFIDLWSYLCYGGITKRMLRVINKNEIAEYLVD